MINDTQNNHGSEWGKWDLHIHTPASFFWQGGKQLKDMDTKEKIVAIKDFIKTLNDTDVVAFCIMDYWTFDWCVELKKYIASNPDELKRTVFTGMELRVECPVNYRLNIHVILSDTLTEQELNDFKSELKIRIGSRNKKLSNEALIEFAKTLGEDKAKVYGYKNPKSLRDDELLELGSKTAEVTKDSLKMAFTHIPKDSGYIVLPYDTSDGLLKLDWSKHPQDDNFFMQTARIFETRDQRNVDLFQGKKTGNNKKFFKNFFATIGNEPKPCVSGSDAHKYSDYGNYPSNKVTWIKAAPTFEGLRQILYEPETRVSISKNEPKKPINTIDSITLQVPKGAKVGKDNFCFADSNDTHRLSPYFNCFIGGRGSGKSTILNFLGLHSNNPDSPIKFWDNLNPSFDPNDENTFSFDGTEIFEFLAQSEIETFAKDKEKFTQAIYNRANKANILGEYEESIKNLQEKLNNIIESSANLIDLKLERSEKEKKKRTLEKSIKVLSSPIYQASILEISTKSKELQEFESWKSYITELQEDLENLIPEDEDSEDGDETEGDTSTQKTGYEDAYINALQKINEAVELLDKKNFTEDAKSEAEIKKELEKLEDVTKKLLEKASLSPENVEQIKSAPQQITVLEAEIKNTSKAIESKEKNIGKLASVVGELKTNKESYEDAIAKILDPLQKHLKKQSTENKEEDIKQISLSYIFDEEKAWHELSNEFYNTFKEGYHDSEKGADVCEFLTRNKERFAKDDLDELKEFISQNDDEQKYIRFFSEVLKEPINLKTFQGIRDKHLYDVKANKVILVEYDGKPVGQASFGQRCTAVVVILILFGNYPLIIDEPEAHLDSSLIANYLVPLLKEKKLDRQIIFATHNANFVINGDSEKVFILKNETGETEIIETTIENIENRGELLKLEGGKEAFEKRGKKLDIN